MTDTQKSTELLPCPFCGGKADTHCTASDYPDWFVQCAECGASADITGPYDLHFWNRRAQPAEPSRTGHAIPQWLRDHFDTIELAVVRGTSAAATFTDMRTKVQAYFEMQRERSESAPCAKSQGSAQPAEQQYEPFAFTTRGMLDIAKDMHKHEYGVGRIGARLDRSDRFCIPLYLRPAAQVVKLPDVDQLSNIIRQVDGNHSLGAGALAEKIIEAVAGLNDYGRHGDEDMMVEE